MRYVLDFGTINAGTSPAFTTFENADTLANLAQPTIVEDGDGLFYFDFDWTSTTATSINYKATVNGVEVQDTITSEAVTTASGAATGGAASLPWLWTAGKIINQAAVEVGLVEVVDAYASVDAHFIRLRGLLKTVGFDLCKRRDWKVLVKECTVTGDGTTTEFNLPADYLRMVDDSGFNRSSGWSIGLLSSKGWQYLKARSLTSTVTTLYRIIQGRIVFYQAPASGTVVAFDYVSRYWVKSSGASTADLYEPASAGDVVMFEPDLVWRLLRTKFLVVTGQAAADEYDKAVNDAADTEPARVLSLNGGADFDERLVDGQNFPITGWAGV